VAGGRGSGGRRLGGQGATVSWGGGRCGEGGLRGKPERPVREAVRSGRKTIALAMAVVQRGVMRSETDSRL
jgi:hypothetical protein